MTHAQADVDQETRRNPRPSGGGTEEGERCTCHLPNSTYPQPGGGIDPDCPKHNPA